MRCGITGPNAIVIGAPKCGTTSLYFYLKQHPNVYLPKRKELHYFTHRELSINKEGPGDSSFTEFLCKSWDEYTAHFGDVTDQSAVVEVSPSYLHFSSVSRTIRDTLGPIKIVVLLRDPVERAYSAYWHMVRTGWEHLNFMDALLAEKGGIRDRWTDMCHYAEWSRYADHVEEYIAVFGRENVHVVLFEEMASQADRTLQKLLRFLDVNDNVALGTNVAFNVGGPPRFQLVTNLMDRDNWIRKVGKRLIPSHARFPMRLAIQRWNSAPKPPIPAEAVDWLTELCAEDVAKTEHLLKRTTGWLRSGFVDSAK